MCHCDRMPNVPTRTRIVVLQHPHERTHPFGTARLVRLSMPNAEVHVPYAGFTGTLEHRVDVPPDTALLYPHPDAPDLADLPPQDHPSTLVVLDGTWGHAKVLYRQNPWLHGLRHVRLQPAAPSNYRIRREPRADFISTIEAIVAALRIIEPDTPDLGRLLTAFDGMIDRQIEHRSDRRVHRFKAPRQREPRALSPLLDDDRLLVVYAEAKARGVCGDDARQLLHWVAARVRDGAVFEAVLRQDESEVPDDAHLGHVRLHRDELLGGEPVAEARARFAAFVDDGAPIAAWTGTTFKWGAPMLPAGGERLMLKQDYCNTSQRRAGFLEQVVEREGLAPPPNTLRGRAGSRLANVLAVARWLRDRREIRTGP